MDHARRFGIGILAAIFPLCAVLAGPAFDESVLQSLPSVDSLVSRLELSPEQAAKLRPLFEKRKGELQETQLLYQHASGKQQKSDLLRDAKKAGDEFNAQVESLLTPSQKHEWREIRSDAREKVKERAEEKRDSQ